MVNFKNAIVIASPNSEHTFSRLYIGRIGICSVQISLIIFAQSTAYRYTPQEGDSNEHWKLDETNISNSYQTTDFVRAREDINIFFKYVILILSIDCMWIK